MADEKRSDFKAPAAPVGDPRFAGIQTIEGLEPRWLREIQKFFAIL